MERTENNNNESNRNPLWIALGVAMLAGASVTLSACNTVEGVGRDVEAAGDGIADTADDAKN